jgi:hypothetical protein
MAYLWQGFEFNKKVRVSYSDLSNFFVVSVRTWPLYE